MVTLPLSQVGGGEGGLQATRSIEIDNLKQRSEWPLPILHFNHLDTCSMLLNQDMRNFPF